jgi:hypothetical protein
MGVLKDCFSINVGSEISLLRQIAIAESSLLGGAKLDRNGETFASCLRKRL